MRSPRSADRSAAAKRAGRGTACGPQQACNADGACVGCTTNADCPGPDNECQSRACLGGSCHDDPCQYTSCPDGLDCVPFDGSCVAMSLLPDQSHPQDLFADGCAVTALTGRRSAASGLLGFLAAGLVLLAARRRRQPQKEI